MYLYIGIDGFIYATNSVLLSRALVDIVSAMASEASNDYVYELCSPARSGSHIVEVGLVMQIDGIRARAVYDASIFRTVRSPRIDHTCVS